MALAAHDHSRFKVSDVRADFRNLAYKFMADHKRNGNGLFCPVVPFVDVEIGAADAGQQHADQNIVDADCGLRHFFNPQPTFCPTLYQCSHQYLSEIARRTPLITSACDAFQHIIEEPSTLVIPRGGAFDWPEESAFFIDAARADSSLLSKWRDGSPFQQPAGDKPATSHYLTNCR